MAKWLYRLESIEPDNGLWYNEDGKLVWGIGKLPDCKTKDLPMDYDPRYRKDGRSWHSSCSRREDLLHWYSLQDADELLRNGFVFTRYLATEYVGYEKETTFIKETCLAREVIDINELFADSVLPEFYLMSGPSGAGKTTFAKEFARENDVQYFGIDDFYALVNGDERRHEDEIDVWLMFYKALHLAEQHKRSIIVDTNAPTAASRTEFLNWFPNFRHHMFFIYAPFERCVVNNASRNRQIPFNELEDIWKSVQIPSMDGEDNRWQTVTCIRNVDNQYCVF